MRNVTIVLAVAAVLALAGPAQGACVWNSGTGGGDGSSWGDAGNWTGGVPTSSDDACVSDGGTAVITGTASSDYLTLALNGYPGTSGHVVLASGSLTVYRTEIGEGNSGAADVFCTFTQTGGTFDSTQFLMVGSGMNTSHGGKGIYTISGGTLNAATLHVGYGNDTAGQEGIFRIEGSGGAITAASYQQTYGSPNQPGVLQCAVDAASGISLVSVTGTATFHAGSILDMDFLGATKSDSWDLFTAGSTANEGNLALKAEDQLSGGVGWTIAWRDGGNGRTLSATYVPEPATLALLGIGGIGVLLRRKRR